MANYKYNSNNEEHHDINPKVVMWVTVAIISLIVGITAFVKCLHINDIQNVQVVQGITGGITINREGGWFAQIAPRIWTYPKASLEVCHSAEKDAINLQFSNKSTAELNCQIGYRIDGASDDQILRLHQFAEGDGERIWMKVYTKLQTLAQCVASQYTPSESVEKFDEFAKRIHDVIIHEPELLSEGIDITFFDCAGLPNYDAQTRDQFAKQKEADLAKRLSEAEKIKLEADRQKTEAQYQREIAEFKGKADAETAKLKTEAERQATLAKIEAQKRVDVEKLEKEQMLIKANKEREVAAIEVEKHKEVAKIEAEKLLMVAEIAKKTEAENLERVRLESEQVIARANAKKEAIQLAGEITEAERVRLTIDKETKIGVATAYADGIGKLKLPTIMNNTTASGEGGAMSSPAEAMKTFFDIKNAAMALELSSGESASNGNN